MPFLVLSLKLTKLLVSELETSKKQTELDKKAVDDLVRERDILNKVWSILILWANIPPGLEWKGCGNKCGVGGKFKS